MHFRAKFSLLLRRIWSIGNGSPSPPPLNPPLISPTSLQRESRDPAENEFGAFVASQKTPGQVLVER